MYKKEKCTCNDKFNNNLRRKTMSTAFNNDNDNMNKGKSGMNPERGDQNRPNQSNTDKGRQSEQGDSQEGTPGKSTTGSHTGTGNQTKPQQ
jgi:hypothetical protein